MTEPEHAPRFGQGNSNSPAPDYEADPAAGVVKARKWDSRKILDVLGLPPQDVVSRDRSWAYAVFLGLLAALLTYIIYTIVDGFQQKNSPPISTTVKEEAWVLPHVVFCNNILQASSQVASTHWISYFTFSQQYVDPDDPTQLVECRVEAEVLNTTDTSGNTFRCLWVKSGGLVPQNEFGNLFVIGLSFAMNINTNITDWAQQLTFTYINPDDVEDENDIASMSYSEIQDLAEVIHYLPYGAAAGDSNIASQFSPTSYQSTVALEKQVSTFLSSPDVTNYPTVVQPVPQYEPTVGSNFRCLEDSLPSTSASDAASLTPTPSPTVAPTDAAIRHRGLQTAATNEYCLSIKEDCTATFDKYTALGYPVFAAKMYFRVDSRKVTWIEQLDPLSISTLVGLWGGVAGYIMLIFGCLFIAKGGPPSRYLAFRKSPPELELEGLLDANAQDIETAKAGYLSPKGQSPASASSSGFSRKHPVAVCASIAQRPTAINEPVARGGEAPSGRLAPQSPQSLPLSREVTPRLDRNARGPHTVGL